MFPSILELKCYHLHHGNPYLKLGPFLLEEKSVDPFIVLFKNILTKNEITHFKDMAKNHLTRSSYGNDIQTDGPKKKKGGVFRTSKQTWLHDRTYTLPNSYMDPSTNPGKKLKVFSILIFSDTQVKSISCPQWCHFLYRLYQKLLKSGHTLNID